MVMELSLKGMLSSLSGHSTPTTADVTMAADTDSSGVGRALRSAILIENQMLKAEAQRVVTTDGLFRGKARGWVVKTSDATELRYKAIQDSKEKAAWQNGVLQELSYDCCVFS
ncbi:hypothetical protein NQZ68_036138 [Dissostichus eleginoides]|nr:hypothetical protein NQZ68_036138 [Dissostichus eleginoides]